MEKVFGGPLTAAGNVQDRMCRSRWTGSKGTGVGALEQREVPQVCGRQENIPNPSPR